MEAYVVFLIFLIVFVIFMAIIIDNIDKKKRNGIKDKNKISKGELDLIEKKGDCMDEYQRILTQSLSYK